MHADMRVHNCFPGGAATGLPRTRHTLGVAGVRRGLPRAAAAPYAPAHRFAPMQGTLTLDPSLFEGLQPTCQAPTAARRCSRCAHLLERVPRQFWLHSPPLAPDAPALRAAPAPSWPQPVARGAADAGGWCAGRRTAAERLCRGLSRALRESRRTRARRETPSCPPLWRSSWPMGDGAADGLLLQLAGPGHQHGRHARLLPQHARQLPGGTAVPRRALGVGRLHEDELLGHRPLRRLVEQRALPVVHRLHAVRAAARLQRAALPAAGAAVRARRIQVKVLAQSRPCDSTTTMTPLKCHLHAGLLHERPHTAAPHGGHRRRQAMWHLRVASHAGRFLAVHAQHGPSQLQGPATSSPCTHAAQVPAGHDR